MELRKVRLGDVCDIYAGGDAPKDAVNCKNNDCIIPIFSNGVDNEGLYGFTSEAKINKPSVTISARGTIGVPFLRKEPYFPIVRLLSVIPKENQIDLYYLYYATKMLKFKKDGSVQQQLTVPMLADVVLRVPEMLLQKKIAAVLSALDDKIALNKKINQKLEAMAKRLYDYWFVQFDFPDENGRPYKTSGGPMTYNPTLKREIPEGWDVGSFGDCIQLVSNRVDPRDVKKDDFYTPIEVIPKHQMSLDECAPIEDATSGLCSYDKKNILLSNRRVYFHKVCIAPFPGLTRDTVIIFKPKITENLGFVYQVVNSDHFIEYATVNSYGSEQPVLSWPTVQDYKIVRPPQKMMLEYSERVKDIIDHVLNIQLENMKLKKMRDKLLPLLMNGQVEVD